MKKLIHFFWFQGVKEIPDKFKANVRRWAELNPGYKIRLWDYDKVSQLIDAHYPCYRDLFHGMYGTTSKARLIKQCDLARLLIVHQHGGCYFDLDLIPVTSIDGFLDSPVVFNRLIPRTRTLPKSPSMDECRKRERDIILSREHCMIDTVGHGVANGVILTKKQDDFWLEFIEAQKECNKGRVLDFVGTHALTRHLRVHLARMKGKIACMPPHYFLWEENAFDHPHPDYTVSIHPAENSWGDHTQKLWWLV